MLTLPLNNWRYSICLLGVFFTGCATQAVETPPTPELTAEEISTIYEDAGTPGEEHKKLEALVGNWEIVVRFWQDPTKEPEISHGLAEHRWVLDGRFVKEDFKGLAWGKRFQGLGLIGYDKVKGEYISTWADSISTSILLSSGVWDERFQKLHFYGAYTNPVTKEKVLTHTETEIVNPDRHIFRMYERHAGKGEKKTLEIIYSRAIESGK